MIQTIKATREIKREKQTLISNYSESFLCEECRAYGYCRYPEKEKVTTLSDEEITNLVPVRTEANYTFTKLGKKLQQAYDLFHQDEYEQASYLYLDILQTNNDCYEGWIGVSASYYFLKKYEDAVSSINNLPDWKYAILIEKFSETCTMQILA